MKRSIRLYCNGALIASMVAQPDDTFSLEVDGEDTVGLVMRSDGYVAVGQWDEYGEWKEVRKV